MPPSRDQFHTKFGDTILADYDEDEEQDEEDDGGFGGKHQRSTKDKGDDEKPPKPTADVMMSRNLKGGVGKNFNFAFSSGDDDS